MDYALKMLFAFVSTEKVLKIVGEYLKTKVLPLAPAELMNWIADLAMYVFAKDPAAVSAVASLKGCAAKAEGK